MPDDAVFVEVGFRMSIPVSGQRLTLDGAGFFGFGANVVRVIHGHRFGEGLGVEEHDRHALSCWHFSITTFAAERSCILTASDS